MTNTLTLIRHQVHELKLYRHTIDAAIDDAWKMHVAAFKVSSAPVGDEAKWKNALLAKWAVEAQRRMRADEL